MNSHHTLLHVENELAHCKAMVELQLDAQLHAQLFTQPGWDVLSGKIRADIIEQLCLPAVNFQFCKDLAVGCANSVLVKVVHNLYCCLPV